MKQANTCESGYCIEASPYIYIDFDGKFICTRCSNEASQKKWEEEKKNRDLDELCEIGPEEFQ